MMMVQLPDTALSVRQPWAWAIIHGGKDVENRSKYAITMGKMVTRTICIHASKGMTRDEYESAASFMESIDVACPRPDNLIRGAIIGTVEVTGNVKESDSDWFFGPWALTLQNAQPVDPISVAGRLGYYQWQEDESAWAEPLPWMKTWPNRGVRMAEQIADGDLLI